MRYSMVRPSAHGAQNLRPALTISPERTEGNDILVVLLGEADLSSRYALSDTLSRVIASGDADVVIDLAQAQFLDSATARVLAECQTLLDRRGRKLTLRSPSKLAARVLDMFGLTGLIERGEDVPPTT
ncbi:MAG: hypothetical protein QOE15_1054 [Acidimicrobiaceae bacterium]|jgi:anti-anti-sigma factor|nr:hypothetical protein [Acidimicrobiaceae bacterium]